MTVTTVYRCDKCGQGYETENECIRCEQQHVMPKEIEMKKLRFRSPCDSSEFAYPTRIRVIMENGDVVIYYYERPEKKDKVPDTKNEYRYNERISF